jgi:hypothetical protein
MASMSLEAVLAEIRARRRRRASWRNTAWLGRNPWFDRKIVPYLRATVAPLLCA